MFTNMYLQCIHFYMSMRVAKYVKIV